MVRLKENFHRLLAKSQRHLLAPQAGPHSILDDFQGLITGVLIMALGITLFQSAELVTGGVMGLALLISYWLDWPLSLTLVLINVPFFILGYCRMGKTFAMKSLLAIGGLAFCLQLLPYCLSISEINKYFAAVSGGLLVGVGLIFLFRHRASMGGFNILVLYLQDKFGWNAGLCQLILDILVIASSLLLFSPAMLVASFLGAFVLNLAISINHRPGRYISF